MDLHQVLPSAALCSAADPDAVLYLRCCWNAGKEGCHHLHLLNYVTYFEFLSSDVVKIKADSISFNFSLKMPKLVSRFNSSAGVRKNSNR